MKKLQSRIPQIRWMSYVCFAGFIFVLVARFMWGFEEWYVIGGPALVIGSILEAILVEFKFIRTELDKLTELITPPMTEEA